MAYADSDDKRAMQRRWERTCRKPRNRSAYHANRRKTIDPNLRTQREDEQRFRWRRKPTEEALQLLHTIHTRETLTVPEFIFHPPTGRWKTDRVLSSQGLEEWAARWESRLKLSRAVQEARG